jgi:hypothetical protein
MSASISHESVIESWIRSALETGGIERFDDLHVDQIDAGWKKRETWMHAGFKALQMAIAIKDRYHLPVDIALAFSLLSSPIPRGIDFKNAAELEKKFDWSPPSLYLLHPDSKPWFRPGADVENDPVTLIVKEISPQQLGILQPFENCYHVEFKPKESSEYLRTLFFMGIRKS